MSRRPVPGEESRGSGDPIRRSPSSGRGGDSVQTQVRVESRYTTKGQILFCLGDEGSDLGRTRLTSNQNLNSRDSGED